MHHLISRTKHIRKRFDVACSDERKRLSTAEKIKGNGGDGVGGGSLMQDKGTAMQIDADKRRLVCSGLLSMIGGVKLVCVGLPPV